MNRKQVIETLEMENELICFNPLTGEEVPLEYVNDLNRNCYDAHQEAIKLINNSIPIDWITKYLHELDKQAEEEADFIINELGGYGTCHKIEYAIGIRKMLEKWEKENELDKVQ